MNLLEIIAAVPVPDGIISVAAGALLSGQIWQIRMLHGLDKRMGQIESIIGSCPTCRRVRNPDPESK